MGGVSIAEVRDVLSVNDAGEADSTGEATVAVDPPDPRTVDESSFHDSVEDVRWRFLKRFQDDLRLAEGVGGVPDSIPTVLLRFFNSLVSFTPPFLSSSFPIRAGTCRLGSLTRLERFCCRRYSSFRMVTALSLASIAESMQDSKSVNSSSLPAMTRWCKKVACTSMVSACRAP